MNPDDTIRIYRYFYPRKGNFVAILGKLDGGAEVRRVKGVMRGATDLPVYSFNAPPKLAPGMDFSLLHRNLLCNRH